MERCKIRGLEGNKDREGLATRLPGLRARSMSTRQFVEFNGDYMHAIEADPEGFLRALRLALVLTDPRLKDTLRLAFGARVIASRHHSEPVQIICNGDVRWSEG
jgi:hypothetical protein